MHCSRSDYLELLRVSQGCERESVKGLRPVDLDGPRQAHWVMSGVPLKGHNGMYFAPFKVLNSFCDIFKTVYSF